MGRPAKVPKEELLTQATLAFWRHGYSNCSLDLLEKATGVDRKGLYNQFQNKQGLLNTGPDNE